MPASKHHRSPPPGAALAALAEPDDADVAALEAEASAGCSACARALVNAREAAVDLAESAAPHTPTSGLRERVLADAQGMRAGQVPAGPSADPPLDASSTVALLHVAGPDEAERRDEITRLGALDRDLDCERILLQVERLIGFAVFFVAVVRGEFVANRVRRGVPPELNELLRDVPRQTTFCTHCVDGDAPLVVENAKAEAFFRGNVMVTQLGVVAYVGVPLKTSRGLTVGTLCALDTNARKVADADVRLLETFGAPVVAELERIRTPELRDTLLEHAAAGSEVYRAPWFENLLSVVRDRAAAGTAAVLVTVSGAEAADLGAAAEPSEVAGRLASGPLGILIPGATPATAEARVSAIRAAVPGATVTVSAL